jgi:hypothetical protein
MKRQVGRPTDPFSRISVKTRPPIDPGSPTVSRSRSAMQISYGVTYVKPIRTFLGCYRGVLHMQVGSFAYDQAIQLQGDGSAAVAVRLRSDLCNADLGCDRRSGGFDIHLEPRLAEKLQGPLSTDSEHRATRFLQDFRRGEGWYRVHECRWRYRHVRCTWRKGNCSAATSS